MINNQKMILDNCKNNFSIFKTEARKLSFKEIGVFLMKLSNGWCIDSHERLCKEFNFEYIESIHFVNKIAEIFESEDHHSKIRITYKKCIVIIWTHSLNCLTVKYFTLAAKIETINRSKIYSFLCALFTILIVIGNLIYQKFVILHFFCFFTFKLSVGATLYPITFLITDLISEFYGKNRANFCIKISIIISIFVALIIVFMNHLNATEWSKIDNFTFNKVFGSYSVSFLSSIIACYISQNIDIRIYLWLKRKTNSKWSWLRNNISTSLSLLIDTIIVVLILGVLNIISYNQIFSLIHNSYIFKFIFTILCTPLFYLSAFMIKYSLKPKILFMERV